jgi:hypothetical protein
MGLLEAFRTAMKVVALIATGLPNYWSAFVCTLKKMRSLRPDGSALVAELCSIATRYYILLLMFTAKITDNVPVAALV